MLKVNNLKICSLFLMFVLFQISVYSEMFTNMTATSEKLATISSPTINKLVVSPDGKRIAYPYNIDGLWYIGGNVDNLVPHAVDRIIPESIKFGEDSQTVAYVVEIDDRYSMCMKNGITQQFCSCSHFTPIFAHLI